MWIDDICQFIEQLVNGHIHLFYAVDTESHGHTVTEQVIRHIENKIILAVVTPVIGFDAKAFGDLFCLSSPLHTTDNTVG